MGEKEAIWGLDLGPAERMQSDIIHVESVVVPDTMNPPLNVLSCTHQLEIKGVLERHK